MRLCIFPTLLQSSFCVWAHGKITWESLVQPPSPRVRVPHNPFPAAGSQAFGTPSHLRGVFPVSLIPCLPLTVKTQLFSPNTCRATRDTTAHSVLEGPWCWRNLQSPCWCNLPSACPRPEPCSLQSVQEQESTKTS